MSFWNRSGGTTPTLPKQQVISPAYRAGQAGFLTDQLLNPEQFRHPDLQAEYAAGWNFELGEVPS